MNVTISDIGNGSSSEIMLQNQPLFVPSSGVLHLLEPKSLQTSKAFLLSETLLDVPIDPPKLAVFFSRLNTKYLFLKVIECWIDLPFQMLLLDVDNISSNFVFHWWLRHWLPVNCKNRFAFSISTTMSDLETGIAVFRTTFVLDDNHWCPTY